MVEDKINMRSIGPYSLITQQPLGGQGPSRGGTGLAKWKFGPLKVTVRLIHYARCSQ